MLVVIFKYSIDEKGGNKFYCLYSGSDFVLSSIRENPNPGDTNSRKKRKNLNS